MIKRTIFFDMDGPLVDMDSVMEAETGAPAQQNTTGDNSQGELRSKLFWDWYYPMVAAGRVAELPPTKDFQSLRYLMCKLRNLGHNVKILSSITSNAEISEQIRNQKKLWLQKHLKFIDVETDAFFPEGSKQKKWFGSCALYGGSRPILIDDTAIAGEAFEEGGGIWIQQQDGMFSQTEQTLKKLGVL